MNLVCELSHYAKPCQMLLSDLGKLSQIEDVITKCINNLSKEKENAEVAQIKTELQQAKRESQQVKARKTELEKDLDKVKEKLRKVEREKETLQKEKDQLSEQGIDKERELIALKEQRKEAQSVKEQITELVESTLQLRVKLKSTIQEKEALDREMNTLMIVDKEREEQLRSLKQENETLKEEMDAIKRNPGSNQEYSRVTDRKKPGKTEFQGPNNPLSNMYKNQDSNIRLYGHTFIMSEHLYQWLKAVENKDEEAADQIMNEDNPFKAKEIGDRVKERRSWDPVQTMRKVIQANAAQVNVFREKLVENKNELVENTKDPYWGKGHDGKGKNTMGKILMEIRGEINGTEKVSPIKSPGRSERPTVLLLGDVQTTKIDAQRFSSRSDLVIPHVIESLGAVKHYITRDLNSVPDKIVIHQVAAEARGINPDNLCTEIARVKAGFEDIVKTIKQICPEPEIVLSQGVQTRNQNRGAQDAGVAALNAILQTVEGVTVVDNSNINSSTFVRNGEELTEEGTAMLAANLKRKIEPATRRNPGHNTPRRPERRFNNQSPRTPGDRGRQRNDRYRRDWTQTPRQRQSYYPRQVRFSDDQNNWEPQSSRYPTYRR